MSQLCGWATCPTWWLSAWSQRWWCSSPISAPRFLLAAVLFVMLVANGARWRHLGTTACLVAAVRAFGAVTASYRWQRLTTFLDPWRDAQKSGFQLVQSLLAFGAGGPLGVGLGAGRQKMFYLPEAHTDFVFAVIGEELGLVGTLCVLGTFGCSQPPASASPLDMPIPTPRTSRSPHVDHHPPGGRQHGRHGGAATDQGSGAAVPQLRRLGVGHELDGDGNPA